MTKLGPNLYFNVILKIPENAQNDRQKGNKINIYCTYGQVCHLFFQQPRLLN
jgi:hypothetical protein